MFKSIVFGIAWCVAAYFLGCVLVGAVAGGIAGAADPNNASALGAQAGAAAVSANRPMIFVGAMILAILGTWRQLLPGTKRHSTSSDSDT